MSKQLNEWLDGFVENGADPNNVQDWSSNSPVYDADFNGIIKTEPFAPEMQVECFLDDTRLNVSEVIKAIKQKKFLRLKIESEQDPQAFYYEIMLLYPVATKIETEVHDLSHPDFNCSVTHYEIVFGGTIQDANIVILLTLHSCNKPSIINFTKGEYYARNNEYALSTTFSLEELHQKVLNEHGFYMHSDDFPNEKDVWIKDTQYLEEYDDYGFGMPGDGAYLFDNHFKQQFSIIPLEEVEGE